MKQTLWTRNYTLLIGSTVLGCIGWIVGGFALSILVFDETGSTLASALVLAMQLVPGFVIPFLVAPWMDRLPRLPFLVAGDAINGILYLVGGVYLLTRPFSYGGYLAFSLILACMGSLDSLAYDSIYPQLIPKGLEQKGYTVSGMLYPVLTVVLMPVAAVLLDTVGTARILMGQGCLSLLAAALESRIRIREENRMDGERYTFALWRRDIREAAEYLKNEPGLRQLFRYMAVSNGVAQGYGPLLTAFFRGTAGFTAAMYSLFSVAEFAGRSLGGVVRYNHDIPEKKRFSFTFGVYMTYDLMDLCLLWLPYPVMLANRAVCGFLGMNSAALRQAAVQRYIPERFRARVNAYQNMLILAASSVLTLLVGVLGEVVDLRVCMSICAAGTILACLATVWRGRADVKKVFAEPKSLD